MEKISQHISDYVDYLREKQRLYISVYSGRYIDFSFYIDSVIKNNFHTNPFCMFVKENRELFELCKSKQRVVAEKCRLCGDFFGMCHAGVCEFVYQIEYGGNVLGFVSVSGYRGAPGGVLYDEGMLKLAKIADKSGVDRTALQNMYDAHLGDALPCNKVLDALIHPLCDMLAFAYAEIKRGRDLPERAGEDDVRRQSDTYLRILRYVNENHNRKVVLREICRNLNCSGSYISHLFKANCGMTINQYVNSLRINEAKVLLSTTGMPINEIAHTVGYNDSNYFTNVFRILTGMSPRSYRLGEK